MKSALARKYVNVFHFIIIRVLLTKLNKHFNTYFLFANDRLLVKIEHLNLGPLFGLKMDAYLRYVVYLVTLHTTF
jgi:hypothetical protein